MMKHVRSVLGLGLAAVLASTAAQAATRKPYVIELADAPTGAYAGNVPGLAATKPAPGSKLKADSSAVQRYSAYLHQKQSQAIALVPNAKVTYRYKHIFNGFAAWLTDDEFAKLAASGSVRAITVDSPRPVDTNYTPSFLGINAPGGAWSLTDANGTSIKGEGVILGHVDGGVWPENPSVSDKVDANGKPVASHLPGTVVYDPLPPGRYTGTCQDGLGFDASMCNNKLVGAQYFNETMKLAISLDIFELNPLEYLDSPRDQSGHGTHTLTTAGGNADTDVVVNGTVIPNISGIAPRARLAAYKACWNNAANTGGSCFSSDSVAAIDKAVEDGVDVINFSIGGSQTSVRDAVETAFANAALAGVFVAASAGNAGPGNTVAHSSPWITTVGNSTHDRYTEAVVTLGSGATAQGASFQTSGVPSAPLIWSRDAGFGDAAAEGSNQALCFGPADDGAAPLLDPAKVTGKILVCDRGGNVLVNKVENARTAGAIAVIIQNTPSSANTTPLISAVLPTVHLTVSAFASVTAEARREGGGTASISPSFLVPGVVAPVMAQTSSRGPNRADPDVLKPDITAPGTDIIAAYTNTSIGAPEREQIIAGTLIPGPGADMISGTSMASPHVAGAAALLRQAHPTWSPFAIKSALLTSAVQTVKLANGNPDPDRWGYGAGHLNPNGALNTTVVYDSDFFEYIDYYFGDINGRQLNLPTLTYSTLVGVGSLTRKLTNRGSTSVTYNVAASVPGYTVAVAPASITLAPGETQSYTVTLTRNGAPLGAYRFGELVWNSATAEPIRSPITVKAESLVAIGTVTDTRRAGAKVITVGTGYDGAFRATAIGLVPASRFPGRVATNQEVCTQFAVPAGAKMLRAQLFNSETEGGSASDLDLTIYRAGAAVAISGSPTSEELVTLINPAASANYEACVEGFAPINGEAAFTLNLWVLPATVAPATLRAAGPSRVFTGGTATVAMSWNVAAGARYLGVVEYSTPPSTALIGRTTVFIDTTTAAPASQVSVPVSRDKTPK